MTTELHRVTGDDWRLLRDVRMRALADAPDAFSSTLSQAQCLSESEWRQRADTGGLTLVGLVDDEPVAMGGALEVAGDSRRAVRSRFAVWGMWTAPAARGRGVGAQVLDALVAWSQELDSHGEIRLHVTEGNEFARRLYLGRGFAPTAAWEALRAGSTLRVEELALALPPPVSC